MCVSDRCVGSRGSAASGWVVRVQRRQTQEDGREKRLPLSKLHHLHQTQNAQPRVQCVQLQTQHKGTHTHTHLKQQYGTYCVSLCVCRWVKWVSLRAWARMDWGLRCGWDRRLAPETVSLSRRPVCRTERLGPMMSLSSSGLTPCTTPVRALDL